MPEGKQQTGKGALSGKMCAKRFVFHMSSDSSNRNHHRAPQMRKREVGGEVPRTVHTSGGSCRSSFHPSRDIVAARSDHVALVGCPRVPSKRACGEHHSAASLREHRSWRAHSGDWPDPSRGSDAAIGPAVALLPALSKRRRKKSTETGALSRCATRTSRAENASVVFDAPGLRGLQRRGSGLHDARTPSKRRFPRRRTIEKRERTRRE